VARNGALPLLLAVGFLAQAAIAYETVLRTVEFTAKPGYLSSISERARWLRAPPRVTLTKRSQRAKLARSDPGASVFGNDFRGAVKFFGFQ